MPDLPFFCHLTILLIQYRFGVMRYCWSHWHSFSGGLLKIRSTIPSSRGSLSHFSFGAPTFPTTKKDLEFNLRQLFIFSLFLQLKTSSRESPLDFNRAQAPREHGFLNWMFEVQLHSIDRPCRHSLNCL